MRSYPLPCCPNWNPGISLNSLHPVPLLLLKPEEIAKLQTDCPPQGASLTRQSSAEWPPKVIAISQPWYLLIFSWLTSSAPKQARQGLLALPWRLWKSSQWPPLYSLIWPSHPCSCGPAPASYSTDLLSVLPLPITLHGQVPGLATFLSSCDSPGLDLPSLWMELNIPSEKASQRDDTAQRPSGTASSKSWRAPVQWSPSLLPLFLSQQADSSHTNFISLSDLTLEWAFILLLLLALCSGRLLQIFGILECLGTQYWGNLIRGGISLRDVLAPPNTGPPTHSFTVPS